jgi:hypothetical protein
MNEGTGDVTPSTITRRPAALRPSTSDRGHGGIGRDTGADHRPTLALADVPVRVCPYRPLRAIAGSEV